ncbi:MAG: DUF4177 domain-containing protein [Paracoccaceae bacterium]|nr:DUF4177 domain-containing protein [Paracoccaceae bacterium]
MPRYTYKIVPAPERARKIKGVKGSPERFAATLEENMNTLAADGWEFVRSETFPVEERSGFTGKKTVNRQVLVYRRALAEPAAVAPAPVLRAAPEPEPEAEAPETDAATAPRVLGRPVPPVTRFRREAAQGSDTD